MIQDIAPKVLHNQYKYKEPTEKDYIAVFYKNFILIKQCAGKLGFPVLKDFREVPKCEYLFAVDDACYFLAMNFEVSEEDQLLFADVKSKYVKMSDIRYQADREFCFAAFTAYHLYQWYQSSQYCGCCGGRMKPDRKERMMYCERCHRQSYPRISPAVIVAVTDGSRILLSKYANREYKRYALIAGFVEAGETAEEAVQREVMEEVGLRVKNIRYYKSQPWGIDANLLLGYFAELDGSDAICLDRRELALAEWTDWEELADMDDGFSLTREMMQVFYVNRGILSESIVK